MQHAVELQLLDSKPPVSLALQDDSIIKLKNRLKDNLTGLPALKSGNISYTGNVYWDLFFLSDIGFSASDLLLEKEIEEIFDLQAGDGTFDFWGEMKPNYFCISAILLSSIAKMGYKDDSRLEKYLQIVLDSQRLDGGWHCAKRRAVGKKLEGTESCPMDNLNILMLLGQHDKYRNDPRFNGALDLLLTHWNRRGEPWRPMGLE